MLRRILREPLVHFLLAGALLFAVFGRNAPEATTPDKEIVVTSADVERLAKVFERTWRRPPSDDELQKAESDFIREEVLYRTALSLGLDKDNMVIRRRLRQKMDFLFEDTVAAPDDSDLRAFYAAHQDKFRTDTLLSFRQIFIDPKRHEDVEGDARELLQRLQSGREDDGRLGDPLLLTEAYNETPLTRIAELFGDAFANELAKSPSGKWSGPLKSPYGLHLVRVTSVDNAHVPPFQAVRDAVQREWLAQHRAAALDEEYRKLQAQYAIHLRYSSPQGRAQP
jgi:PPIC-type PPIASE domain